MPDDVCRKTRGNSNASSIGSNDAEPGSILMLISDQDSEGAASEIFATVVEATASIEDGYEPSDSNEESDSMDELANIDHTADLENGVANTPSNESGHTDHVPIDATGTSVPVFEDSLPSLASPLLLCGTKSDIVLLDPSRSDEPVVGRIPFAMSRPGVPVYGEMLFDRLTFLEWIPELSVAAVGSFTGTVAIVSLQQAAGANHDARFSMQVRAHLPAEAVNKQLYGLSVYRHPLDTGLAKSVTLLLTFIDGMVTAYELGSLLAPIGPL
ncbi:hypothetical protein H4R26_003844 [Coemansia thaxteri]|uniref:Uncharacterized protein n=1 Tax=Coemansia thaxteri TaxID=2663907 RepID=A0A9W8EEL9_9FUNG|nr:hypothetical protein H4R26_003844 [Coemansia thaxteri]KAJ2487327.1 hypothetical protein EV174_000603 [Coemansia sp. RSA 2320]